MSAQLLILLLAFVMEDQNLLLAALLDHVATDKRTGLRFSDLAVASRNRQNIAELNSTVGARTLTLDTNDIAGRNPVLLPTSADDRVHAYVS
jgi:hypothetical protein